MPIVRKSTQSTLNTQEATAPPEAQSSGIHALRNVLGLGTRLVGGFMSNVGGLPGALIGGATEGVAEGLEGSLDNAFSDPMGTFKKAAPKIAVEAGIGMVPLGKTISEGRAILSAGKGMAFNAAGDVGRQYAEGNFDTPKATPNAPPQAAPGWNMGRTAFASLMGAGVNGLLGHLSPKLASEAAPKPLKPEIVDNGGRKLPYGTVGGAETTKPYSNVGQPMPQSDPSQFAADMAAGGVKPRPIAGGRVPYGGAGVGNRVGQSAANVAAEGLPSGARSIEPGRLPEMPIAPPPVAAAAPVENVSRHRLMENPEAYNREIGSAFDEASQEGRLRDLKRTLKVDDAKIAPEAPDFKWGPDRDEYGRTLRGVELDDAPSLVDSLERGSLPPSEPVDPNSPDFLPSDLKPIASNTVKSAPVSVGRYNELRQMFGGKPGSYQTGMNPPLPEQLEAAVSRRAEVPAGEPRVASPVEGPATRADSELNDLMDGNQQVSPDDITDPVSQWMNAEVKNPGPDVNPMRDAYYGPFHSEGPRAGVTSDIPGQNGQNWGSQVEDDIRFRNGGEDVQIPPRGMYEDHPGPIGYPGGDAAAVKNPVAGASTDDQSLQDLLDYLNIDSGYRNADSEGRKALGKVFGRSEAQAKASNAPQAVSKMGADAGATASKSKAPMMPDIRSELGQSQTEAMLQASLGLLGAGTGYAADRASGDDSGIDGALIGGALGAGALPAASMIPKLLESVHMSPSVLNTPEGKRKAAEEIFHAVPQWMRFSYLSDPRGLVPNAWVGPYGSMMTGAIEAGLSGDERGWRVLKNAWNPLSFAKEHANQSSEAVRLFKEGEMGRSEGLPMPNSFHIPKNAEQAGQAFRYGTSLPGLLMTQGDLAARKFLMDAGFNLEEAQRMTMTAEPRTDAGHGLANFGRKSQLLNILFPFKRTPANMMEEGASRTPGLGFIADYLSNKDVNLRSQLVQQAGGLASGVAGYKLGENLDDPKSSWQNLGRRSFTNAAGRYSVPATIGVTLGQTLGQGKKLNKQTIERMAESIPLPGVDSIVDAGSYLTSKAGINSNDNVPFPLTPGLMKWLDQIRGANQPPVKHASRIRKR